MIVFPMAGMSSRFQRAGYSEPKWKLPVDGRPLLDWSLLSFENQFASETFVIAYLDSSDTAAYVKNRVASLGIKDVVYVPLPTPTRGQADTVHTALELAHAAQDEPLTIFNIDTMRPGCRVPTQEAWDGWVECFHAEGDGWSFVLPNPDKPRVALQVVEKRRVSDLCSTGVYYFRTRYLFEKAFETEISAPSSSELFVAPLYQHLIDSGLRVGYDVVDASLVISSGTPSEYEALTRVERLVSSAFGR